MNRRIPDIENLRAIAILLVLVQHIQGNLLLRQFAWLRAAHDGFGFWIGVDVFFAVSGYVIARDLLPRLAAARDLHSFAAEMLAFWVRRFWRLVPSAWLWLVIILLAAACYNRSGAFGPLWANVEATVAAVFYLANFRMAQTFGSQAYGASFVYWSLALEEQFYLLLPMAVLLFRRALPGVLIAAVLLQCFVKRDLPYLLQRDELFLYWFRTDAILLGVLVAWVQLRGGLGWLATLAWRRDCPAGRAGAASWRTRALMPGLIFGAGVIAAPESHIVDFAVGMVALISALLVAVAACDRGYLCLGRPVDRVLGYIGRRSYAIYLAHMPVIFFVREFQFRHGVDWTVAPPGPQLFAALALIFVLAECNYRFVEQPLRRRGAVIAQRIAARSSSGSDA